jgi:hypothetical protein
MNKKEGNKVMRETVRREEGIKERNKERDKETTEYMHSCVKM